MKSQNCRRQTRCCRRQGTRYGQRSRRRCSVAQIALAEAHVHLFVVVDRVCAAVLRVRGTPLDAHPLGGHVVIWWRGKKQENNAIALIKR